MSDANLILLADIGGTNLRFALCESAAVPLRAGSIRRYRAAEHSSLGEAAAKYLDEVGARPQQAVLAIAGRVDAGEVHLTNLPWSVSAATVASQLGLDSVRVVNDFAAQSRSLPLLRGGRAIVLETEGGHLSFAAGTDEEIAIFNQLRREYGRVSNERVICGSGLVNLYGAICTLAGAPRQADTPEQVMQAATAASDAQAVRAVELFGEILGAIAGDLVLAYGAWDGVFLAGGLLDPLLPTLRRGGFRTRFDAKGRFTPTMKQIPTVAVRHPNPGLLGAAGIALDLRDGG